MTGTLYCQWYAPCSSGPVRQTSGDNAHTKLRNIQRKICWMWLLTIAGNITNKNECIAESKRTIVVDANTQNTATDAPPYINSAIWPPAPLIVYLTYHRRNQKTTQIQKQKRVTGAAPLSPSTMQNDPRPLWPCRITNAPLKQTNSSRKFQDAQNKLVWPSRSLMKNDVPRETTKTFRTDSETQKQKNKQK